MSKDEDIFSEDYGKGKKPPPPPEDNPYLQDKPKPEPEPEPEKIEETPKDESKPEEKKEITDHKQTVKVSTGKAKIIGVVVIGIIIALVAVMATGIVEIGESIPFDASECKYGVKSGFFEQSCMTQSEAQQAELSKETAERPEQPKADEPFKETSSASDRVDLELNNGISGYYMVSSCCNWYGDFVDIGKVPKKIENAGNTKVNFICFSDEHLGTSTYFATFKNVIDPYLSVDVFINDKKVDSKTTTSGSALILEGSCLGN